MSKLLNIVIPYYNASKTIENTLMSICIQSIKDKCKVIIIDDGSTKQEYHKLIDIIKKFNSYIDIDYIHYDENRGPGYARQKGLDNCDLPYVTFIDADDVYATSTALFLLCNTLDNNDECAVACGNFIEEVRNENNEYVSMYTHKKDMTWIFGKVYRLSFIDKYNIEFNDSRANEDSGFNGQFLLCAKKDTIQHIDELVYCWNYNVNSITKTNDYSFYGLKGYIENHIWCIHKIYDKYLQRDNDIDIQTIISHSLNTFVLIYLYRIELAKQGRSSDYIDEFDSWALNYYIKVYIFFSAYINTELLNKSYFTITDIHPEILSNYIPQITIYNYINHLNTLMLDKLHLIQIIDTEGNLLGYVKSEDKDKVDTENLDMEADYFINCTNVKDFL